MIKLKIKARNSNFGNSSISAKIVDKIALLARMDNVCEMNLGHGSHDNAGPPDHMRTRGLVLTKF